MIAPLAKNFIILSALVQDIFYVLEPPNTKEVRVCFDFEDCNIWRNMRKTYAYDEFVNFSSFNVSTINSVNITMLRYKLQIMFSYDTVGETKDWRTVVTTGDQMLFDSDHVTLFVFTVIFICNTLYMVVYMILKYKYNLLVFLRGRINSI